MTNQFNEGDHRRDGGGKFSHKQHGVPTRPLGVPTRPQTTPFDAASSFAVSERDRERFSYKGDNIPVLLGAKMAGDGEASYLSAERPDILAVPGGAEKDPKVDHYFNLDGEDYVHYFTSVTRRDEEGQTVTASMRPDDSVWKDWVTVKVEQDDVESVHTYKGGELKRSRYEWVGNDGKRITNQYSPDGSLKRQNVFIDGEYGSVDFDDDGDVRQSVGSYWLTNPSYEPPCKPQPIR